MKPILHYQFQKTEKEIEDFVYAFSALDNLAEFHEGVIIPNGRIDLTFCKTMDGEFQILLMGLETHAKPMPQQKVQAFFSISFNPLALEYILKESVSGLVNSAKLMPANFWEFQVEDMQDFTNFCSKATQKIKSLLPSEMDSRKQKLFQHIFANDGHIQIKELADNIGWSERQINRYFHQKLGISLKTYCNILRFQASLPYIQQGKLAPQFDNFTDQSHFIKEIKKLAGVSPKTLFKNENDRFLQFLVYTAK